MKPFVHGIFVCSAPSNNFEQMFTIYNTDAQFTSPQWWIQGEIQGSKGTPLLLRMLELIFSNLQ